MSFWLATILMLVSSFLPVIPTMTSTATTHGREFLANYSYSYEFHLSSTMMDLSMEGWELKVEGISGARHSETLQAYFDGDPYIPSTEEDAVPIASYINEGGQYDGQYDLLVYYSERRTDASLNDLIYEIETTEYVSGTTDVWEASRDEFKSKYRPSFIVFNTNYVYTEVMNPSSTDTEELTYDVTDDEGSTTSVTTSIFSYAQMFSGDWYHHTVGDELIGDYLNVTIDYSDAFYLLTGDYSNVTVGQPDEDGNQYVYVTAPTTEEEKDALLRNTAYQLGFAENWYTSFDNNYKTSKNASLLYTTLLYFAIYLVIGVFLGLIIYLLTRGKNNYYRYLKFMTCQKITAWAAVTPSLLAMILGFFMPSYAIVFYIALFGLRVMWMCMQQLRGS